MTTRVLFGAGIYARKYTALLEYLGMDFDYFVDNDCNKWGKIFFGKKVISPDDLLQIKHCEIIISCIHKCEIYEQLQKNGFTGSFLTLQELYQKFESKILMMPCERCAGTLADKQKTLFIDIFEGLGWGGTEQWAYELTRGIKEFGGITPILLGNREQTTVNENCTDFLIRIPGRDTIAELVELFEKSIPFVLVNNFGGCALLAADIVKHRYPGKVKIVSVIHNDKEDLFDEHLLLHDATDIVFCVSNQIRTKIIKKYGIDEEKCAFKEQPIWAVKKRCKKAVNKTINIAYAGRLVRCQKRSDLLPDFICSLEEKGIDYHFQIAGEGECFPEIERFIQQQDLSNRVELLGRLDKENMGEFWENQDVFINLSEFEGTSLSMLEAMGHGCTPVVTNVSGAHEFITEGENGYICEVGDLDGLGRSIQELYLDRKRLERYGEESRKRIIDRCDPKKYMNYWLKEIILD